jgi:hypothetical protein
MARAPWQPIKLTAAATHPAANILRMDPSFAPAQAIVMAHDCAIENPGN